MLRLSGLESVKFEFIGTFCRNLAKWADASIFVYPLVLSLISALIFWLVFSYWPEHKRRKKLRPIVELCLFECYQCLFSLFDLLMKYQCNSPSFYQNAIRGGTLSDEEIRLGLQNKCLNESYLYDSNVKNQLLIIGDDIYRRSKQIEGYTDKIIGYSAYASAKELILVENIVHELKRYDFGEHNVSKQAATVIGGQTRFPSVPAIYYRSKNFSDLYKQYCSLQELLFGRFGELNRNFVLNKVQYLYYSGQYAKCKRFCGKRRNLSASDARFLQCYSALCERSLGKFSKFYKLLEKLFGARPFEGGLVYSRSWLSSLVNDKKALELLAKFHAKTEIDELLRVVANEEEQKKQFIDQNRKLSVYFSKKDPRLPEIGPL